MLMVHSHIVKDEICGYFCHMKPAPKQPKRGPRPKGFLRQHVFLPADLAEWAKNHPEGLSGLIRRLLKEEQAREA